MQTLDADVFERIINLVPDAMLVVDGEGVIVDANDAASRLFGYDSDSLTGSSVELLVPPDRRAGHPEQRKRFHDTAGSRPMGAPMQIEGVDADGRIIPLDIMLAPVEAPEGRHTLVVARDITRLRDIQEELVQKNDELARLNERKNQFVGMAAHDLRNPLGVIVGYMEALLEGAAGAVGEEQRLMLDKSLVTARSMLTMVSELLDVAAIESGKLRLDRRPTDIERLVQEVLTLQRMIADHKDITIRLHTTGRTPMVNVDPGKIEQVLHNLLNNAVKYVEAGTPIDVAVNADDATVSVSVKDRGPGIASADHERVFEPFQVTDAAPTGGESSTGLGLAITRRIVEGHGGWIHLDSHSGEGAQFTVHLPHDTDDDS